MMDNTSNPIMFSFIIPVYNTQNLLSACVESITSQSYSHKEIILVDDGSSDGSPAICDNLSALYDYIRVIHQPNQGSSVARNVGTEYASGDYIIYVDSDDCWVGEDILSQLACEIEKNRFCDQILFGVNIFYQDGTFRKARIPSHVEGTKLDRMTSLIYNNEYISPSYNRAIKRELMQKHSIVFTPGSYGEDIEWSARLMVLCDNIASFPRVIYKRTYRDNGSITSNIGQKHVNDILSQIPLGLDFIKENGESPLHIELYNEYWAYQYSMILAFIYGVTDCKERERLFNKAKEMRSLLKYNHLRKVKLIYFIDKLLGFKATVRLLNIYVNLRSKRKHT